MLKMVTQKKEVDEFRDEIVSYIARRELDNKAFTCWLSWFDDNREEYYVQSSVKKNKATEEPKAGESGQADGAKPSVFFVLGGPGAGKGT